MANNDKSGIFNKVVNSVKASYDKAPATTVLTLAAVFSPLTWPIVIPGALYDCAKYAKKENEAGRNDDFKKRYFKKPGGRK